MPYFYSPYVLLKIQTTTKNTQRYYTTKYLIRYMYSFNIILVHNDKILDMSEKKMHNTTIYFISISVDFVINMLNRGGFPLSRIFYVRTRVKNTRQWKSTFTRGFSYITSILIYARKASSSLRPYARKNYATVEIHLNP